MEGATRIGGLAGFQRRQEEWSVLGARVRSVATPAALVAGLVLLAAFLRFATLHVQSYDYDELQTVRLLRMHFGSMLAGIARDESTPPLYYVLAWAWSKAFGTGEAGLRALSALFGTAMVPLVYVTAKRLASRRAALVAALLISVSPWLVWYSQEARTYALVALLGALSFWSFTEALAGRRGVIWAWALSSALAIT